MTAEGKVSKEIKDGLRALGWRVLRLQSGQVKVKGGFMHLCPTGTPDVLAFDRQGVLLWIEIKAALGKRSQEQVEFAEWAQSMGHRYVLARSLDDVLKVIGGAA